MVKRILAALIVLAMLTVITACGHTHEDTDSDGVCNGCGEKMSTTPEDDKPSGEGGGSTDKDEDGNTDTDTDGEGDTTPGEGGSTTPPAEDDTPTPPGGGGVIDTPKDEF